MIFQKVLAISQYAGYYGESAVMLGLSMAFWLILFIIGILLAVWVYKDAKSRYPEGSSEPIIWLIIVLIFGLIGLIIYLLARPKKE